MGCNHVMKICVEGNTIKGKHMKVWKCTKCRLLRFFEEKRKK